MYILESDSVEKISGGSAAEVFSETGAAGEAAVFASAVCEGAEIGAVAGPVGILAGAAGAALIAAIW